MSDTTLEPQRDPLEPRDPLAEPAETPAEDEPATDEETADVERETERETERERETLREAPTGASLELAKQAAPAPHRDLEMDRLARLGMWLAASETDNPTKNELGAQAALRIYLARELGLPITAASELSFIRGRLNVGAHLQRYLAWEAGIRVLKVDASDEEVTAVLVDRHSGEEIGRSTFTLEEARRRGSIKQGGGYTKNPQRMLWARATTEALKDHAPHVQFTLGIVDEYDASEMVVDDAGR